MKKLLTATAFLFYNLSAIGQSQTVQFNANKLLFDNGAALPHEKSFLVTTDATPGVALIKMQVSNIDFKRDRILSESIWSRNEGNTESTAVLPNSYKLRGGQDYNFRFLYYRKIAESERSQIVSMLQTTAATLLRSNIQLKDGRYRFSTSPSELFKLLNESLKDGMVNYEAKNGIVIPNFSGIVENALRTMAHAKATDNPQNNNAGDMLAVLIKQVDNEIEMITNSYYYVLDNSVVVSNYPVEKTQNTLALDIGYAGIYNSGEFNNLDYFSGPYAGISLPLGNSVFSGRFWSNASLSLGVFLQDFKVSDSIKVSGPVVDRPLYAALGYNVFRYLKIHAGAAVLEERNSFSGTKSVYVKPFVGLSLAINLWLGFNKK